MRSSWRQEAGNLAARSSDSDRPTILCIGESTTALGGQAAYPVQLEQVLGEAGRAVTVVNKGIPATTTDVIVDRLPGWIDQYRPRVVVAMMGVNDPPDDEPPSPVPAVIRSLRVYKLVAYIADGLTRRFRPKSTPESPALARARQLFATGRLGEARDAVNRVLGQWPDDVPARLLLARILYGLQAPTEGDRLLASIADEAPAEVERQRAVVWHYLYVSAYDRARAVLARALAVRPSPELERLLEATYYTEAEALARDGRPDAAAETLQRVEPYVRRPYLLHRVRALLARARGDEATFRLEFEEMARLKAAEPHSRTARSFEALRRIAKTKGVRLVAVQYPLRSLDQLKEALDNDPDIVFVDNKRLFRDAVTAASWETYFWDVFAGDFGHLTAAGNRLLAENAARGVLVALDGEASANRVSR